MKRFHVHVSVEDLNASIGFYSKLFGSEPAVQKADYAKWMLEDPRLNFAISQRGHAVGLNHLGFQVDSDEELNTLRANATQAEMTVLEQGTTNCCYAKSDKYWLLDPQGIAWENFRTLEAIPVFGEEVTSQAETSACCVPASPQQKSCCS